MKRYIINKILGVLLFVALWQILSMIIGEDTFIFPSPITTFKEVIKMMQDSYTYRCITQTMIRMLVGFAFAFVLAFILGIISGNNKNIEELLGPTMTILKSIPTATLVYLFLVVVGSKLAPLLIVILVSFPILYESVLGGIKATPKELLEACILDSSSFIAKNVYVRIPLALPYIIVGIASSFALSLKIEIMAEVITGYTRLGLGSAILAAQRSDPTNMIPVFSYSLIAIIIMLFFDLVSNLTKRKYSV